MVTGGDEQQRYQKYRQQLHQARIKDAKKTGGTAGTQAGAKTKGQIKGGDLFTRKGQPESIPKKGQAGSKTAGRIKGDDVFQREQPQPSQPQKDPTLKDKARDTARTGAATVEKGAAAVETGAATVEKGAATVETGAATVETAAKGTETAAQGAEALAKGVGAASKATGAASTAALEAGEALSATGLGSIIGVPLAALGGAGAAASKGTEAAATAGGAAAKSVKEGAKVVGEGAKDVKEGAKEVKEGAQKVKEGARDVKEQAGDVKDALGGDEEQDQEELPEETRDRIRKIRLSGARMRLSDARDRTQEKGLSPTRFEMGRKHFGVADPDRPDELTRTPGDGTRDLFDAGEQDMKRKAALRTARMAERVGGKKFADKLRQGVASPAALKGGQLGDLPRGGVQTKDTAKQPDAGADAAQQMQDDITMRHKLAQIMMTRQRKQQLAQQKSQKEQKAIEEQRAEVKQTMKAGFRRGIIYIVDLVAAALDLSSGFISFLVDMFVYMFSLGWLNLEMFYGKWIAKGKSRYISPISWAPFKMPVDKDAFMLQGLILMADLALMTAFAVVTVGTFCVLHDYMLLVTDPLLVANSLANGGGKMCLGGILGSLVSGI